MVKEENLGDIFIVLMMYSLLFQEHLIKSERKGMEIANGDS